VRHAAATLPLALAIASSIACSSSEAPPAPSPDAGPYEPDLSPLGGNRPVTPVVPSSYRPGTPVPLLILLHGHGASGLIQSLYFGLPALAEQRGFILLAPDGTFGQDGARFWNATDACCQFDSAAVDDVAYLTGLIDEATGRFSIDPKRIYLAGHSNGGFMSYRMSCDRADLIAAMVSLAGAMWNEPSQCHPSGPVAVLQIHGTADDTVLYDGGTLTLGGHAAPYPSAEQSVLDWVAFDGCTPVPDTSAPLRDLVSDTDGPETSSAVYAEGCSPGGHAELWTMSGASHIPGLLADFTPSWLDFLMAHPKP
jgi:polyhydroxybutyrate depolymerase